MKVQKELTLKGNIVISVGCFSHTGDVITDEQKIMLNNMHKRKIDMADEIFVINVGGYIGNSTRSEIEYAEAHDKKVNYLTDNNLYEETMEKELEEMLPYFLKELEEIPDKEFIDYLVSQGAEFEPLECKE